MESAEAIGSTTFRYQGSVYIEEIRLAFCLLFFLLQWVEEFWGEESSRRKYIGIQHPPSKPFLSSTNRILGVLLRARDPIFTGNIWIRSQLSVATGCPNIYITTWDCMLM